VYSLWLTESEREIEFPALVLIVSGGHTELLLMTGHGQYQRLGGTLDDAAGEAFDKVGRLLGLPFPGGPNIERAAMQGNDSAFEFPRARLDSNYDFSFSGLKTAVLREATVTPSMAQRGERMGDKQPILRSDLTIADVAASFQKALVDALVEKTVRAAKEFKVTEILLAGGVSANQALRREMKARSELPVRYPPLSLCTDNGAMIAAAAYQRLNAGLRSDLDMDVKPMWALTSDAYTE
jgi:N6-L-threonylcarbamoyladenine synthase